VIAVQQVGLPIALAHALMRRYKTMRETTGGTSIPCPVRADVGHGKISSAGRRIPTFRVNRRVRPPDWFRRGVLLRIGMPVLDFCSKKLWQGRHVLSVVSMHRIRTVTSIVFAVRFPDPGRRASVWKRGVG
jgi:hypothetical protein